METTADDTYKLYRHAEETKRLNLQHRQYGYILHPLVAKNLPPKARVAEIATGTAVWLIDLASTLPPATELYGFDISSAQYPPASALPANVNLQVHNAKLPFPPELHGTFDAVHIRLLIGAVSTKADWANFAANALALLKPGGRLQWCECNFSSLESSPAGLRSASVSAPASPSQIGDALAPLVLPLWDALRPVFAFPRAGLAPLLRDLGCATAIDAVASDRVPGWRAVASDTSVLSWTALYAGACRAGLIAHGGEANIAEQTRRLGEAMRAEMARGMYLRWEIFNIVATKS